MSNARCRPLLALAVLPVLFACASDGATKAKPDAPQAATAKQGAQMAQGVSAPPAGAPGKPGYLQPRSDGTYVDAKGNILTPPPVMLGVTMEQPGKALVKHLGINPARTTLLIDVIPGLPAAKAGVEDHDIVIAVDGSQDASPADIRRKLKGMKAGDTITFTVRRGSESKTVTLAAAAWQAEHMVRPLHAGSFAKPNLNDAAERDSAPRELQPVMDRLDRIEKQLQQLSKQSTPGQPAVVPAPAAKPAAPAKPATAAPAQGATQPK
jgi:membrane-associated protease RseP (regulator of RpoE activity)